jgi:hypothetical protein
LIIQNNTDYQVIKTYETSYQMNSWKFPSTIAPRSSDTTKIEYNASIFNPDLAHDTGDVGYKIACPNGSFDSLQIQARQYESFWGYKQKVYVLQHQFNCVIVEPESGQLNWGSDPMIVTIKPLS